MKTFKKMPGRLRLLNSEGQELSESIVIGEIAKKNEATLVRGGQLATNGFRVRSQRYRTFTPLAEVSAALRLARPRPTGLPDGRELTPSGPGQEYRRRKATHRGYRFAQLCVIGFESAPAQKCSPLASFSRCGHKLSRQPNWRRFDFGRTPLECGGDRSQQLGALKLIKTGKQHEIEIVLHPAV